MSRIKCTYHCQHDSSRENLWVYVMEFETKQDQLQCTNLSHLHMRYSADVVGVYGSVVNKTGSAASHNLPLATAHMVLQIKLRQVA